MKLRRRTLVVLGLASCALWNAPAPTVAAGDTIVSCKGAKRADWFAINDLFPPPPDHFYVSGKVEVANPAITPKLTVRSPQGTDPAHVQLDFTLEQAPGAVAQVVVTKDVRFDQDLPTGVRYRRVSIFCEGEEIETLRVGDAQ
jgi:hypothetical protein